MKIGIDLDDVLSNSTETFIEFHNKFYGTNINMENLISYGWWEITGGSTEDYEKKLQIFQTEYFEKHAKPVAYSRDVLEKLKKDNELYIITARTDDIKKYTEDWINKNFPNIFSKVYYTSLYSKNKKPIPKGQVCDELGIDIFIEDNLKNVLECAKANRKVFLLNYPWNQVDKLPKEVMRVNSWKEIENNLIK